MHPRSFGSDNIVRTEYVHTFTPSCKPDWNFAFQVPAHFGGKSHNHLACERRGAATGNASAVRRLITTQTFREKRKTTRPILSFKFILISTLTWITEKELEREIKNKGDQFRWKKNVTIFIAVVRKWELLAATEVKMSGREKKLTGTNTTLVLHKTCN